MPGGFSYFKAQSYLIICLYEALSLANKAVSSCPVKTTLKLGTVLGDRGPSVPSSTGMAILLSNCHGHLVWRTPSFH